jgi:hypothetical protein
MYRKLTKKDLYKIGESYGMDYIDSKRFSEFMIRAYKGITNHPVDMFIVKNYARAFSEGREHQVMSDIDKFIFKEINEKYKRLRKVR